MKREDFVIQTEVRRLLVRANIDYSKIDFGTVNGVVYLRGAFRLASAVESHEELKRSMATKALVSLERRIRSIPGVVDVVFQLNNWAKEKGQWIPIQSLKTEAKRGEASEAGRKSEEQKRTPANDGNPETKTV
ncbi:MAG: hypothetical protein N3G78_12300 [Desulfobacterota bacterium]|nr:hypothetical protein [Thermodesulfobacteriota bacterium]